MIQQEIKKEVSTQMNKALTITRTPYISRLVFNLRCWERLKAGGEGDNRGWDGWMASPTQWTWVWASSRSWWWTGRSGMLQSMGVLLVAKGRMWLSHWTDCLTDQQIALSIPSDHLNLNKQALKHHNRICTLEKGVHYEAPGNKNKKMNTFRGIKIISWS